MEITTPFTEHEELAEALRGVHGKDIGKDFKIAYCGQIMIGEADNTEILDKNCRIPHYEWKEIGNKLYIAFIK